ncbi:DUF305 domain-containing protein [Paraburkholderia sp. DHOC27]|uniref:DUF305 domain-containing protein n=1 Tax=Paraburkholderia sp. DHOC27 TaxID=2303330 RepID=UPI000E3BA237|nr:DUF305 domain-containing protein [Paraburkholderia sp. DHOC27]RFU48502.1 DUF305 domain-containing protein [Paraburkholderia sp. DHOC27]
MTSRKMRVSGAMRSAAIVTLSLCAMASANAAGSTSDDAAFMKENDAAMTKMMSDMDIKPTGNVDRDFVAMMQPHHQAAIEMAEAELRYGHNEQLRQIATQIISQQRSEIVAMGQAVGASAPGSNAASNPSADQSEQSRPEVSHKNPKMDGPPGS